MPSIWKVQVEAEERGRIAAQREQQRIQNEAAAKREKKQAKIQAEIDKKNAERLRVEEAERLKVEMAGEGARLKAEAEAKQRAEKEQAEKLQVEQAKEKARLKAEAEAAMMAIQLQKAKEVKELRRKKEEGWTENELELLRKLKYLGGPLESEENTMPQISVTDLEDTARLLHQNSISVGSIEENIIAFDWAVRSNHYCLAQLLVSIKEFRLNFPSAKSDPQMIILQLAAELGHLEIVNLILEHLPQTVDPDSNHLALILAIGNGHEEVVKKLLEHVPMPMNLYSTGPAGLNALGIAVKNGRIHMVQLILDKTHVKPDEYVEDWDNKRTRKSALHLAAEGGHKSIMEAFLFCAKVNLNVNDAKGTSPLLTAVECDQIGIVELLLADNRVEINHKDSSGNTALLIALMKGKLPLAQLFLDHKNLNANDTNAEGVTALMMAASLGCSLSISKLLRYADIDVNSRAQTTELLWGSLPVQTSGWSALEIANAKGFRYIEYMLSTFVPNHSPTSGTQYSSLVSASTTRGLSTSWMSTSVNTMPVSHSDSASASIVDYQLPEYTLPDTIPHASTQDYFTSIPEYEVGASGKYYRSQYSGVEYESLHKKYKSFRRKCTALEKRLQAYDEEKSKYRTSETGIQTEVQTDYGRSDEGGFGEVSTQVLDKACSEKPASEWDHYENNTTDELSSYPTDTYFPCTTDPNFEESSMVIGRRESRKRLGNENYGPSSYSFSSLSTTVQPTVSLSANISSSLSHTQSAIGNFISDAGSNSTTNVGELSHVADTKAHSAIYARTTGALSTTVHQSTIHATGSVSTSDGVNWSLAAPATLAAIFSGGLAGYAVKLQRSGIQSQSEQILFLKKIDGRLASILAFIQAAYSLPIGRPGSPPSDPPADFPTLSPRDVPVLRCLIETEENTFTESESFSETPSVNFDSRSEYTSEDNTPDESDPTDSMKLAPLDRKEDQIDPQPQVAPVTEYDVLEIYDLSARFAALRGTKCQAQRIEDQHTLKTEQESAKPQDKDVKHEVPNIDYLATRFASLRSAKYQEQRREE